MKDELWTLWQAWWRTHGEAERNALIEAYIPACRMQAYEVTRLGLPDALFQDTALQRDDLVQIGLIAVANVIPKVTPCHHRAVDRYVYLRIRGEMVESFRRHNPVRMRQAGRPDKKRVIHKPLHVSRSDPDYKNIKALQSELPGPYEVAESRDLQQSLLEHFSLVDRIVLRCRYQERMTLHEIGDALGVSEGRVSQLARSIRDRIRAWQTNEVWKNNFCTSA